VQTVHEYLKIIIHTCQRGKEGSRADCACICSVIIHTCQRGKEGSRSDCAHILRDYYSHVPAWKGRVTLSLCTYI
jgi:hypothetical protein